MILRLFPDDLKLSLGYFQVLDFKKLRITPGYPQKNPRITPGSPKE